MPPLEVIHMDFPSAINALGIKGVGESGVISPAAAVANAVEDALAHLGVVVRSLPITPEQVCRWLREA
jgi:carbon-monoxide dehydrogenase large subunit